MPRPDGRDTLDRVSSRPAQGAKVWLVVDKRLSEKLVERLEKMELVEESFIGGQPTLQLTIVGRAIEARLQ